MKTTLLKRKRVTGKPAVKITVKGDVSQDIERIFGDGVLVDLKIGHWSALKRNTPEKLGLSADEIPDDVSGLGMHRLMSKEVVDGWRKLAGHARYTLRRHSFVFPVGQCAFVPKDALAIVEEELATTKRQFEQAAQRAPARMRHAFYMEWDVFNVTLPKRAQLAAFDRKKAAEGEKALKRYQQRLEQRMGEFVADVVGTMRTKVVQLCQSITEKIKTGDVVTNRSINSLHTFIARFREMNFVGDSKIEDMLSKLEKEVLADRDAAAFKDDAALQKTLVNTLDGLRKAAEGVTDVSEITGGYRRKIRV